MAFQTLPYRITEGLLVVHPGIGWKRHGSNSPDPDLNEAGRAADAARDVTEQ